MAKDEGFLIDEIVTRGRMPYFPVGKVAKLLGVEREYIDGIFGVHPEIVELTIGVEDNKTVEYETYVDPVGCALIAMNCETRLVGEELKISIAKMIDLVGPGQDNMEAARRYIDSTQAHRFVKALFEWSFEHSKDEDFWSKLPEQ